MPIAHSAHPSVEEIIERVSIPYKRKGYGMIVAISLAISSFYFGPIIFSKVWPYILENIPHQYVMFWVGITLHTGLAVINNTIFYIIYKIKLPFFERYRVSDKPWPWESNPEQLNQLLKKTFKVLAFSHLVLIPGMTLLDGLNGPTMRMDLESMPSVKEIVFQLIFFMICEDFMFYWCHRTLHHPKLYPYIHKLHHEYNITVSIAGEYAHPIEALFGNMIPMSIGPKLLGSKVHVYTYLVWAVFRLVESVDGHSGYEFSWSLSGLIPLSPISSYHNFHHSHNIGNYGSLFTFWDTLCGTNTHYYEHQKKKDKKKAKGQENIAKTMHTEANGEQKGQFAKGSTPENRIKAS
jgi:sterol desaturase/sphingolipid hydroxylase (fatty acid hydroxylase superfamily)